MQSYQGVIDHPLDAVDFAILFVEGVRLANAHAAAAEKIAEGDLPPLEESVREQLATLLQVHGVFMMSTIEGIEAIAAEERYSRTPQQERQYHHVTVQFARSLQNQPALIKPAAAAIVLGAAEQIGIGSHAERSGVAGSGMIRNVTITLAAGATIAALPVLGHLALGTEGMLAGSVPALLASESLKKSKTFAAVIAPVTRALDSIGAAAVNTEKVGRLLRGLRNQLVFLRGRESILRRLAGSDAQSSWLNEALDWIAAQTKDGDE